MFKGLKHEPCQLQVIRIATNSYNLVFKSWKKGCSWEIQNLPVSDVIVAKKHMRRYQKKINEWGVF